MQQYGIMIWSIIIDGVAGWLASIIMGKNAFMGILVNVIVGIIGGAMETLYYHSLVFIEEMEM